MVQSRYLTNVFNNVGIDWGARVHLSHSARYGTCYPALTDLELSLIYGLVRVLPRVTRVHVKFLCNDYL